MKAILAVNNLGFIGLGSGLPWKCKSDFKHFKSMTMDCTLLVGHNTFLTLPPLEGRRIVVLGRDTFDYDEIDWCIGGAKTYERFSPLFTELHISHINDNTIGDVMIPNFRYLNPKCKIFSYRFEID